MEAMCPVKAAQRTSETGKDRVDRTESQGRGPIRLHRVQRTGHSSLAVTLPKLWTTDLNIRSGDPVVFRRREDGVLELSFAPTGETEPPSPREMTIDASGAGPGVIGRLLVGAYITGQDRIVVIHPSKECRKNMAEIDRAMRHLVGMNLIGDSEDRLEFLISVDPARHQHLALHRRLAQMLHMEIDMLRQSLTDADLRPLARVPGIEDEIDRFYYLIARQVLLASYDYRLARACGVASHSLQLGCELLSKMLEVVADVLANVGTDIERGLSTATPPPELREELSRVLGRFDDLLESTLSNLSKLEAPEADRTLEDIRRASDELAETRDRWMRGHDKETSLLSHMVVLRLLMGMELLKVVNVTIINRVTEPDVVAQNRFRPVVAGSARESVASH